MHDMDTSHDHTNNTHSLRLGSFLLRIRPSMNQTFHESVRWKTIANRLHDRWGCHPPDHNYLPSRQTATLSVPVWITQSYIKTCCYQSLFANNLKCNHLHTHIKKLSSTWHTLHIQQSCLQSAPIACHAADNPASECQHTFIKHILKGITYRSTYARHIIHLLQRSGIPLPCHINNINECVELPCPFQKTSSLCRIVVLHVVIVVVSTRDPCPFLWNKSWQNIKLHTYDMHTSYK